MHGDQPGSRLARRLRLPQPHRSFLRRPRDRQLPVDSGAGHLGPGRARGQARSSSACRRRYPPRKVNGISVGCFLTPDTTKDVYTHPPAAKQRDRGARRRVPGRRQGIPHRQQGLAQGRDLRDEPQALRGRPALPARTPSGTTSSSSRSASTACTTASGSTTTPSTSCTSRATRIEDVIRDYYRYLDDELGRLLELLTDDTVVLVRLRPRRAAARRRLLRQRVAGPGGPARPERVPEGGHAVRQARRQLGQDQGLERGRLLRPRLLQREGPRAERRDRARRTTSGSATRSRRSSRRPPTTEDEPLGTLVFKPEEIYQDGAQRRARPDRPLRRPSTGARSAASATRRSTSRRTTPGRTTATTPSIGASSSPRRTTRCTARYRERTSSTSPRRCWSWAATTSRRRCRENRWFQARR